MIRALHESKIKCKTILKFLLLLAFAKSRVSLPRHCEIRQRRIEAIHKNKNLSLSKFSVNRNYNSKFILENKGQILKSNKILNCANHLNPLAHALAGGGTHLLFSPLPNLRITL